MQNFLHAKFARWLPDQLHLFLPQINRALCLASTCELYHERLNQNIIMPARLNGLTGSLWI